jgi:hypothetical protein
MPHFCLNSSSCLTSIKRITSSPPAITFLISLKEVYSVAGFTIWAKKSYLSNLIRMAVQSMAIVAFRGFSLTKASSPKKLPGPTSTK